MEKFDSFTAMQDSTLSACDLNVRGRKSGNYTTPQNPESKIIKDSSTLISHLSLPSKPCTQPAITYSKLTVKTLVCQNDVIGVFFVNFEHISHVFLVLLLLTLSR